MGNVGATSKPIQDKSSIPPNLLAVPQIGKDEETSKREPLDNPGSMEELHKKCKGESRG